MEVYMCMCRADWLHPPTWKGHFALRKQISLRHFLPSLSAILLLNCSQAGKNEDFHTLLAVHCMLQCTRGVTDTLHKEQGITHSKWLAKPLPSRKDPFPINLKHTKASQDSSTKQAVGNVFVFTELSIWLMVKNNLSQILSCVNTRFCLTYSDDS